MSKNCKKCGAPITGFWAKVSKIFGVKQSVNDPDLCNKCEEEAQIPSSESQAASSSEPEVKTEEPKPDAPSSDSQETTNEPMVAPVDDVMVEPADDIMQKPDDDVMKTPEVPQPQSTEQKTDPEQNS